MTRRMRDPAFRAEQRNQIYAAHVAPINQLVDELKDPAAGRWLPYQAPCHGGSDARVLLILRDPGPKANDQDGATGSGFLCLENDDSTAARICHLLEQAGLSAGDIAAWNAYPWYMNQAPTAAQRQEGVLPLARLLALLPCLQVVILFGNDASDVWRRLERRHSHLTSDLHVLPTRHPSPQAFITRDPAQRQTWLDEQGHVFQVAARQLTGLEPKLARLVATEAQIEHAFAGWLRSQGWIVNTQVDHVDIVASRDGRHLIAEVKGQTSATGTDIDTAFGQLLRRMTGDATSTRYAIVAPESSRAAILRVPQQVRSQLHIDVYLVDVNGGVHSPR